MAPPLVVAGVALAVGGTVFKTVSAVQNAKAAATNATQNAELVRAQAQIQAGRVRRNAQRRQGALAARTGPDIPPLDVVADLAAADELSALDVLFSGELRARDFDIAAINAKQAGKGAIFEGIASLGSTLLTAGVASGSFGKTGTSGAGGTGVGNIPPPTSASAKDFTIASPFIKT